MGIYFLAAGTSTKNREKSLDRGFSIQDLQPFLNQEDLEKLGGFFTSGEKVFLWGATEKSFNKELRQVSSGEYVVDVKNEEIVQIFSYCFFIDIGDDKGLQEYLGWDWEKPIEKRHYRYVFFLKNPRRPKGTQREKSFFQTAFNEEMNMNWLVGQKWFSGSQVSEALKRAKYSRTEEFLGISC